VRSLGLTLLLAFVMLSIACEPEAGDSASINEVPMGQVFSATKDGWDIVVKSAITTPQPADALSISVEVNAMNKGQTARSLGPDRFKLKDASGREWKDEAVSAAGALLLLGLQDVQPGFSTTLSLSFHVPGDARGLYLETIGGGRLSIVGQVPANAEPSSEPQPTIPTATQSPDVAPCPTQPPYIYGSVPTSGLGDGVALTAAGLCLSATEVTIPANRQTTLFLVNDDPVPHQLGFYTDAEYVNRFYLGDLVPGSSTWQSDFAAREPDTYYFRCELHPDRMIGRITIQ